MRIIYLLKWSGCALYPAPTGVKGPVGHLLSRHCENSPLLYGWAGLRPEQGGRELGDEVPSCSEESRALNGRRDVRLLLSGASLHSIGVLLLCVVLTLHGHPRLCHGCVEAKVLSGLSQGDLNQIRRSSRQRTGQAFWVFSSQLSNRRQRLKEKLPWGSWPPAQVSQHPVMNEISRLGMPLSPGPLLPAPQISSRKDGEWEATGHVW